MATPKTKFNPSKLVTNNPLVEMLQKFEAIENLHPVPGLTSFVIVGKSWNEKITSKRSYKLSEHIFSFSFT